MEPKWSQVPLGRIIILFQRRINRIRVEAINNALTYSNPIEKKITKKMRKMANVREKEAQGSYVDDSSSINTAVRLKLAPLYSFQATIF